MGYFLRSSVFAYPKPKPFFSPLWSANSSFLILIAMTFSNKSKRDKKKMDVL